MIMTTAIVTWISYNNYGSILQAYAIQRKLLQNNIQNVIISDKNILEDSSLRKSNSRVNKAPLMVPRQSFLNRTIKIILNISRLSRIICLRFSPDKYKQPYLNSQFAFEKFRTEDLYILKGKRESDIFSLNSEFDAFIAGSDQIWSVSEQDFNPYYFLDFVQKPKIAYAPSIGTTFLPTDKAEQIKMLLSDFSAISVREQDTAKQLSELLHRKVEWVADPTLLHDSQFWSAFTAGIPVRKKPYLLCYFLENKDWYFSYAKRLAKQLHLSIVLLPNKWDFLSSAYVVRKGVGPKEFVSLIQHAEFVLTDSYHGSIFSLIFNRNFLHLLRFSDDDKRSQNIRIYSLFNYLRIDDRIVTKFDSFGASLQIENYSEINKKIEKLREKSIHYLQNSLASVISTGS